MARPRRFELLTPRFVVCRSARSKEFRDRLCSSGAWRERVRSNMMIKSNTHLTPPMHAPCHPE